MQPSEAPVVRGRHMKSLVAALEAREGGARPLALLQPGVLEGIAAAGGLDWLPVALNLQVTQAIYDGLGASEADRFFRAHTLASFEGPILQTLVSTGVRMFGLDPISFARWIPRGWHMIFRGTGTWKVPDPAAGSTSVVLTLSDLPLACAEHQVWARSVSRSLTALLDLARVSGSVDVMPRAPGPDARFTMRWTPRGEVDRPPA